MLSPQNVGGGTAVVQVRATDRDIGIKPMSASVPFLPQRWQTSLLPTLMAMPLLQPHPHKSIRKRPGLQTPQSSLLFRDSAYLLCSSLCRFLNFNLLPITRCVIKASPQLQVITPPKYSSLLEWSTAELSTTFRDDIVTYQLRCGAPTPPYQH